MNSDDAVSEVLGFVLVFGLVIILVSVVTAAALPNLIKETEIEDNEKVLSSFWGIKKDMDTFCLAEVPGMKKQVIIDTSDKARLSVSHGKKVGEIYRELKITYEAENILAEKVRIVIDSNGLTRNGKSVLPPSFLIAVNPKDTAEQMESGDKIRIEYSYQGTSVEGGYTWHLFSIRLL
ncbi:MAG TPA: hypothetical protein O0X17_04385 [Methanocorpusculum sp.]|nr:hypothetical protein [Methanocorpusculum sp.]